MHHEQYEHGLAATRAGLDPASFTQSWYAGHALSPEALTALVAEIRPARD